MQHVPDTYASILRLQSTIDNIKGSHSYLAANCITENLEQLYVWNKRMNAEPVHQHFGIVPDYLNGLTGLVSELQSLQSIYMASSDFRGF